MLPDHSKIMVVLGTRPEVVKLGPVIEALREHGGFEVVTLATAQHREMLDDMLAVFGIEPRHDLNIMTANQSLVEVTVRCLQGISRVLKAEHPDLVLVQGDTTTVMSASIACYYHRTPVGHVEAGLRTSDKYSPFPEEVNRRVASVLADLHFAPTERARDNLLREGVPASAVSVTGNTVIDAVHKISAMDPPRDETSAKIEAFLAGIGRLILVTVHRRESFGQPLADICAGLTQILDENLDTGIVLPVHPNPNVRQVVLSALGAQPRALLIEPLDYLHFVHAMKRAHLLISDSGGVQEEAPSLSKPVLVLREKTERPEGVEAGVARLVGTSRQTIVDEANRLLRSSGEYEKMVRSVNPYGDGAASRRIVAAIERFVASRPTP
jgi:UDP-N-acetylglucosamine 2-epimerase (non-hydrolysing)